jgi:hypothetical protein
MGGPGTGLQAAFLAMLRPAGREAALCVAAGMLAAFGLVSLSSASFTALIPVLGTAGALALNGLALLMLAGVVMALARPARPPPQAEPPKGTAIDPMMQLAFDLSFLLGERLAGPRR